MRGWISGLGVLLLLASAQLQAALVGTAELFDEPAVEARSAVQALLARDDVVAQLHSLGVDPEQAQARVAAMNDEELAALHGQLEALPAGGSFWSAVAFVFVFLLITDILGYTDVFTFVR